MLSAIPSYRTQLLKSPFGSSHLLMLGAYFSRCMQLLSYFPDTINHLGTVLHLQLCNAAYSRALSNSQGQSNIGALHWIFPTSLAVVDFDLGKTLL